MTRRSGIYIVPTHRWYIERTVWLIAGIYLLTATALARWSNPLWVAAIIVMALISINVSLTGFCLIGNGLKLLGFLHNPGGGDFVGEIPDPVPVSIDANGWLKLG